MFQSGLHARSRGNMIVCLSIILKRTDVPRTRAVVTVRVQVKARRVVSCPDWSPYRQFYWPSTS